MPIEESQAKISQIAPEPLTETHKMAATSVPMASRNETMVNYVDTIPLELKSQLQSAKEQLLYMQKKIEGELAVKLLGKETMIEEFQNHIKESKNAFRDVFEKVAQIHKWKESFEGFYAKSIENVNRQFEDLVSKPELSKYNEDQTEAFDLKLNSHMKEIHEIATKIEDLQIMSRRVDEISVNSAGIKKKLEILESDCKNNSKSVSDNLSIEINEKNSILRKYIDSIKDDLNERLNKLISDRSATSLKKTQQDAEIIQQLDSKIITSTSDITLLKEQYRNLSSQNEKLSADLLKALDTINELSTKMNAPKNEENLQEAFLQNINDLKAVANATVERENAIEQRMVDLEEKVDSINHRPSDTNNATNTISNEEFNSKITGLDKKISTLEQKLTEFKNSKETDAKLTKIQEKIVILQADLDNIKQNSSKLILEAPQKEIKTESSPVSNSLIKGPGQAKLQSEVKKSPTSDSKAVPSPPKEDIKTSPDPKNAVDFLDNLEELDDIKKLEPEPKKIVEPIKKEEPIVKNEEIKQIEEITEIQEIPEIKEPSQKSPEPVKNEEKPQASAFITSHEEKQETPSKNNEPIDAESGQKHDDSNDAEGIDALLGGLEDNKNRKSTERLEENDLKIEPEIKKEPEIPIKPTEIQKPTETQKPDEVKKVQETIKNEEIEEQWDISMDNENKSPSPDKKQESQPANISPDKNIEFKPADQTPEKIVSPQENQPPFDSPPKSSEKIISPQPNPESVEKIPEKSAEKSVEKSVEKTESPAQLPENKISSEAKNDDKKSDDGVGDIADVIGDAHDNKNEGNDFFDILMDAEDQPAEPVVAKSTEFEVKQEVQKSKEIKTNENQGIDDFLDDQLEDKKDEEPQVMKSKVKMSDIIKRPTVDPRKDIENEGQKESPFKKGKEDEQVNDKIGKNDFEQKVKKIEDDIEEDAFS